jgi:hypothetical protein
MLGYRPTQNSNTPSLQTGATALAANAARIGWSIQNQGTNVIYVLLGVGASTSVYHFTLKAGTGASDGSGASITQTAGIIYNGIITVAGTTPSYTVLEMAP